MFEPYFKIGDRVIIETIVGDYNTNDDRDHAYGFNEDMLKCIGSTGAIREVLTNEKDLEAPGYKLESDDPGVTWWIFDERDLRILDECEMQFDMEDLSSLFS